jgi:hypothetical protein
MEGVGWLGEVMTVAGGRKGIWRQGREEMVEEGKG